MIFDTLCISGVGLIGGSLGIAARQRGLVRQVIGAVRRESAINVAFQRGAVDNATTDLAEAARGADAVFLATPVGQMGEICRQLAPVIKAGAIVSDGGSTKAGVVHECEPVFGQKAHFIGGHPMAGSDQSGVEASRGDLFEGAIWILTPTEQTPPEALQKWTQFVEGVGATPLVLSPQAHDQYLAVTSHLPHLTASALVQIFARAKNEDEIVTRLIASGWRDSTRIAAGHAEMWRDICLHNKAALQTSLDEIIHELTLLRALIEAENGSRLQEWLEQAAIERRKQGYFPRSN